MSQHSTTSTVAPGAARPRTPATELLAALPGPIRRRAHWGLVHGLPRLGLRVAARRGDPQAQFMVATHDASPRQMAASVETIRAIGPLVKGRIGYTTVSHAVCREVLTSSAFITGIPVARTARMVRVVEALADDSLHPLKAPSLLVTEAPDHTRMRKLTTRVFTGRAVARLSERTQEIADDLLRELSGEVDVVEAYCARLPVAVICEILGVPRSQEADVLRMGTQVAASLDIGSSWSDTTAVNDGLTEFTGWMARHLAWLRKNPGENLLSDLVRATDEEGVLQETELIAMAGLILAAGFETTVNLLSNGIRLLHDHPDQRELLRRNPSLWGNAVEEVLRFDPPVLLTGRLLTEPITLAGVPVPAHTLVTTVLAGANRDPEVFTDPDRFDVARPNAAQHLSFSAGRHHCLGAALARMEGEIGLRSFFDHFGQVEVLPGAHRRPTRILRGWEVLRARVAPRPSSD